MSTFYVQYTSICDFRLQILLKDPFAMSFILSWPCHVILRKPLPISMAQLNYLDLKVSGMDSTRLDGPKLDAAAYKASLDDLLVSQFLCFQTILNGKHEPTNPIPISCMV